MLIKYGLREYGYDINSQQIISDVKDNLSQIIAGDPNFSTKFKTEIQQKINSAEVYIPGISNPPSWNNDLLQRFAINVPNLASAGTKEECIAAYTRYQQLETEFPEGYELFCEVESNFHVPNLMLSPNGYHTPNSNRITVFPAVFFANLFNGESVETQRVITKQTIGHEFGHMVGEHFLEDLLSGSINIWHGPVTPQTIQQIIERDKNLNGVVGFSKPFGEQWEQFALKIAESLEERTEAFRKLSEITEESDQGYGRQSFGNVVNYFKELPDTPDTQLWQRHNFHDGEALAEPICLGSIKDMGGGYFQEVLADVIGLKVALYQQDTDAERETAYRVLTDHFYAPRTDESGTGFDVRYPVAQYRVKSAIELFERSLQACLFPI
jgi:hypothetical protein